MKRSKIFGILALVIILSLLIVALPAAPALAATITLSPITGPPGTVVTVWGTGFTIGDAIDIDFNGVSQVWVTVAAGGSFTVSFPVPSVTAGTYPVRAVSLITTMPLTIVYFTVTGAGEAEITIRPDEGQVGTEVEINGEGFDSSEDIRVEYDGDEVDIEDGDEDTDTDGEFKDTIIIIPESIAGDHTITVIGDYSDVEAEAEFTVEPQMTISPDSGSSGTTVTVTGTGFDYKSDVTIRFDDDEVAEETTDKYGSFRVTFNVPVIGSGTYDVEAEDEDDNTDKAEFTIATNVGITPTSGNVGTKITVTGAGFLINRQVTITYDDKEVATVTADSGGVFSASFDAPVSIGGNHNVIASDGTNRMTLTFTMESLPPLIPAPLKPEMGAKAEAEIYFDWEDVTDDSLPVTYTFQIATDEDFSEDSIVLEKEGLTKSEYTITETAKEKLEPTKKEAPYYWRVKVIDSASNESEWTGVGEFYVGFAAFALPDWIIYVWFAIGAVIVGVVGFLVGRKTSYYA